MSNPEASGNEIADALNRITRGFGGRPEETHTEAGAYLVDIGLFGVETLARSRMLGCIACQLFRGGEQQTGAYARKTERCTGVSSGAAVNLLKDLVHARILMAREEQGREVSGHPRLYYKPTNNPRAAAFVQRLKVPEVCGLERQNEPSKAAEDYLIRKGVVKEGSIGRRAVLGCIACQLGSVAPGEKTVNARTINQCLGRGPTDTFVFNTLAKLASADILDTIKGSKPGPGRHPTNYSLSKNKLTADLRKHLEAPEPCGLELSQPTPTTPDEPEIT